MGTITNEAPLHSTLASDPDLCEIVELFVMEMPNRVASLRSQFETHNWEELRRTAHQLKGAAGSYGFDPITPSAGRLEDKLRENPSEQEIKECLEELVSLCSRITADPPE